MVKAWEGALDPYDMSASARTLLVLRVYTAKLRELARSQRNPSHNLPASGPRRAALPHVAQALNPIYNP